MVLTVVPNATKIQKYYGVFFTQFGIINLDSEAAIIAGRIRAELAARGTPIGPYDLRLQQSR
jgi:predicted nucleic acid-binding protein